MGLFDSIKEAFESDPQKLADWEKDLADLQAKLASASAKDSAEIQKEIDAKAKQVSDLKAKLGIVDGPAPEVAAEAAAAAYASAGADVEAKLAAEAAAKAAADEAAAKAAAEEAAKAAAAKAAADEAARTEAAALAASVPAYRTYEVKPGDTLSKIGREFGVTYSSIAELNGIENPDLIYPGQVFKIPN